MFINLCDAWDEKGLVISMIIGNRKKCMSQEASSVFQKSVFSPR